jgi:hypothetical protein
MSRKLDLRPESGFLLSDEAFTTDAIRESTSAGVEHDNETEHQQLG